MNMVIYPHNIPNNNPPITNLIKSNKIDNIIPLSLFNK